MRCAADPGLQLGIGLKHSASHGAPPTEPAHSRTPSHTCDTPPLTAVLARTPLPSSLAVARRAEARVAVRVAMLRYAARAATTAARYHGATNAANTVMPLRSTIAIAAAAVSRRPAGLSSRPPAEWRMATHPRAHFSSAAAGGSGTSADGSNGGNGSAPAGGADGSSSGNGRRGSDPPTPTAAASNVASTPAAASLPASGTAKAALPQTGWWGSLPPHRPLAAHEMALRVLKKSQAALRDFAAAQAAAMRLSDDAKSNLQVSAEALGAVATATSASALLTDAEKTRELEACRFALEELKTGNQAPARAVLERDEQRSNAAKPAAVPASAADTTAATSRVPMPPVPPSEFTLRECPVLPWSKPILPGSKVTLRIPIAEIANFLQYVTKGAGGGRPGTIGGPPRYVTVFQTRDEFTAPLPSSLPSAPASTKSEAEMQRDIQSMIEQEIVFEPSKASSHEPTAEPSTPEAAKPPSPSQADPAVAATPAEPVALSSAPPTRAGSSSFNDDHSAAHRDDVEEEDDDNEAASSSSSGAFRRMKPRRGPFPGQFKRSMGARSTEDTSTSAQRPAPASASPAKAGSSGLKQYFRTLTSTLRSLHSMGTVVELLSFPAARSRDRQLTPLSIAALEAAMHEEQASGYLSVRVLALHRADIAAARMHTAGFLQCDVRCHVEARAATPALLSLPTAERAARLSAFHTHVTALHARVSTLLQLHAASAEEPVTPRRASQLFAYDRTLPGPVADHAVSLTTASNADMQRVLAELDPLERLKQADHLVAHDVLVLEHQLRIRNGARDAEQRTLVLEREKELVQAQLQKLRAQPPVPLPRLPHTPEETAAPKTSNDPNASGASASSSSADSSSGSASASAPKGPPRTALQVFTDKIRSRLPALRPPPAVLTLLEDELGKLDALDSDSGQSVSGIKHYVDWLSSVPWGVYSDEHFRLRAAEATLERDHFGMREVKDQILELISIGWIKQQAALREAASAVDQAAIASASGSRVPAPAAAAASAASVGGSGKILCLVGPPGVGKTSIGRSIATALDRKFFRFSVGGLGDVSEIKGHRRTYLGALPGQLVRALKQTGVSNPVILIDEIDKLAGSGRGGRSASQSGGGDPSSALLEVLDPEQNNAFMDHFLDTPLDLSRVLFICTANDADSIAGPLRDRMEFVRVSGYTAAEKLVIARRYLLPALHKSSGVKASQISVDDDALESLIRWYCREPGVRSLNQHLEKLFRKVAYKIARASKTHADKARKEAPAAGPTTDAAVASASSVASSPAPSAPLLHITDSNLSEFVGQRKFASDRLYPSATPPGVAMGLAYSESVNTAHTSQQAVASAVAWVLEFLC